MHRLRLFRRPTFGLFHNEMFQARPSVAFSLPGSRQPLPTPQAPLGDEAEQRKEEHGRLVPEGGRPGFRDRHVRMRQAGGKFDLVARRLGLADLVETRSLGTAWQDVVLQGFALTSSGKAGAIFVTPNSKRS